MSRDVYEFECCDQSILRRAWRDGLNEFQQPRDFRMGLCTRLRKDFLFSRSTFGKEYCILSIRHSAGRNQALRPNEIRKCSGWVPQPPPGRRGNRATTVSLRRVNRGRIAESKDFALARSLLCPCLLYTS